MHVLICNERLIPRFGVDRLLLVLGRGLVHAGHRVTFLALRLESRTVRSVSPHFGVVPVPPTASVMSAEDATATWLNQNWPSIGSEKPLDVVVVGGWPFFGAAAVATRRRVPSIFIDAGAVPHDGLTRMAEQVQRDIRRLRVLTLPDFSAIWPISDFVRDSQTIPDRGHAVGVRTILLGADHLLRSSPELLSGSQRDEAVSANLRSRLNQGERLLIALGRFEPRGYKNSPAAFSVLRTIRRVVHEARLLVLDAAESLSIPDDLRRFVVPIGFPSDNTLREALRSCAVGLTPSLWEGFNLPLAEMQCEGRPVLALDVGAHPEVICHPWFLCSDVAEMAEKAQALLFGKAPLVATDPANFSDFRERFRWEHVIQKYIRQLSTVVRAPYQERLAKARPTVLLEQVSTGAPGDVIREFLDHENIPLVNVRWQNSAVGYVMGGVKHIERRQHGTPPAHLVLERVLERESAHGRRVVLIICGAEAQVEIRILWARARGFGLVLVGDSLPPLLRDLADSVWPVSEIHSGDLPRLFLDLR